jgi:RNA polymerase sigma-70 factor (ECF subfamily)
VERLLHERIDRLLADFGKQQPKEAACSPAWNHAFFILFLSAQLPESQALPSQSANPYGILMSRFYFFCRVINRGTIMTTDPPDTDDLLRRIGDGDRHARGQLLKRHQKKLRRLIALRLDPRLAARLDPSDIVQESLAEADRRLDRYVRERPLPFYPWLRQLALERLVAQRRRHLRAGRRSVLREEAEPLRLPDHSADELAEQLLAGGDSPSAGLHREELRERVRAALEALPEPEREVLVLRYLEQMSAAEVAAVLAITEAAAKKRALRALRRLRSALTPPTPGESHEQLE